MSDSEAIRAFLALDPPADILRRVTGIQEAIRKNLRGPLSWVRPEGMHLTLKFFGTLAVADVGALSKAVAGQTAGVRAFELEVSGLGVFPGPRRPRVLWLGIGGEVERLMALQKDIDRALEALGFPREQRPFKAHLTLARIKSPQEVTGLDRVLAAPEFSPVAGAFRATGLTLFKSVLTPKGALYTALGHFPFQE